MSDAVVDARHRLPSLEALEQVCVLLNVPGLGEAERRTGAAPHQRQAVLLATIAEWAALSAQVAGELTQDAGGVANRYAYMTEVIDEHSSQWWVLNDDPAGEIEASPDGAESFALIVVERFLAGVAADIAAHPGDDNEWMHGDLHLRVTVWDVSRVAAAHQAVPDADSGSPDQYWRALRYAKISPDAVQVRTPTQIIRALRDRTDPLRVGSCTGSGKSSS